SQGVDPPPNRSLSEEMSRGWGKRLQKVPWRLEVTGWYWAKSAKADFAQYQPVTSSRQGTHTPLLPPRYLLEGGALGGDGVAGPGAAPVPGAPVLAGGRGPVMEEVGGQVAALGGGHAGEGGNRLGDGVGAQGGGVLRIEA